MNYKYVAYTHDDKKLVKGMISGASEAAAAQMLLNDGFQPVALRPSSPLAIPSIEQMLPNLFKPKAKDIIAFTKQLAILLDVGITIIPALNLIREETTNKTFKNIIAEIIEDIRTGNPFSAAVAKHDKVFNTLYCQVVAVGERTGGMADSLRQAATYLEKDENTKKKIKKAMIYPAIVLCVAVVVISILTLFVLPRLTKILLAFDTPLPVTTRIMISFTDFVSAYWPVIFGSIGLIVVAAIAYSRRPSGRYKMDKLLISIPVVGKANLMAEMARLSRTLALLVRVGLPLSEALEMAKRTSGNLVVKDSINNVRTQLLQGEGLSGPMSRDKIFPRVLVQMVVVGEESGKLESTLETASTTYEVEADERISGMVSLIEPVMILVLASIVGFIAISTITPMYSITNSVK